jgi:hypothetical protein
MQQRLDGVESCGLPVQALDQVQVARSKRANHWMIVSVVYPACIVAELAPLDK